MEIKFGKHKGKTVESLAQTQEGRAYLLWLTQQPTAGQYEALNKKRNKEILEILSLSTGASVSPKEIHFGEKEAMSPPTQKEPAMVALTTELKEVCMCINELIKVLEK